MTDLEKRAEEYAITYGIGDNFNVSEFIDFAVKFATEVTKELQVRLNNQSESIQGLYDNLSEAKELVSLLSTYVRDNCYTRTLGESLDRQGLLEKAEAFLKE